MNYSPLLGISTSRIGRFPFPSGFTRQFLFNLVKKNQPKEAMSFRFSKDEYQLSISTYSGLNPRSRAIQSIS